MSTTKSSTALAKAGDPAAALAELVKEFGPAALRSLDDVAQAFKIAEGVVKIREVVASAIDRIKPLAGSPLGFRTDKDATGGYPPAVLIDCATEALLRGLRLTGNEWNVIGGRCYVAQAGFARLVSELDGLTDLELSPGIPAMKEGGAIVEYAASWRFFGTAMTLRRSIPIRVNNGMGADAILGKAKRKMLAAVHERVTGSVLSEGEADDAPLLPAGPARSTALLDRAAEKRAGATSPPPPPVERDADGNPIFPDGAPPADTLFPNPGQRTGGNLPD